MLPGFYQVKRTAEGSVLVFRDHAIICRSDIGCPVQSSKWLEHWPYALKCAYRLVDQPRNQVKCVRMWIDHRGNASP